MQAFGLLDCPDLAHFHTFHGAQPRAVCLRVQDVRFQPVDVALHCTLRPVPVLVFDAPIVLLANHSIPSQRQPWGLTRQGTVPSRRHLVIAIVRCSILRSTPVPVDTHSGSRMIESESTLVHDVKQVSWNANTWFCKRLERLITTSFFPVFFLQQTRRCGCCWAYSRYLRPQLLCSSRSLPLLHTSCSCFFGLLPQVSLSLFRFSFFVQNLSFCIVQISFANFYQTICWH